MAETKETSSNGIDLSGLIVPLDMETLFGMNQKICRTMMACNDELLDFGRSRLKQDLDMPQKLAGCKSPQDIMGIYVDFYQEAMQQYVKEASSLSKICSEMATAASEDVKPTAK